MKGKIIFFAVASLTVAVWSEEFTKPAQAQFGAAAGTTKGFSFEVYDKVTIRKNPTSQIVIRVADWPGQNFLLWFPEAVGDLWQQWDPPVAHQEFVTTDRGGLRWQFRGNPRAAVTAELIPRRMSLLLEVRVRNLTDGDLRHVPVQNCLHLSQAPDFASGDFSRIYIRTNRRWRSLAELKPTVPLPMYYRHGVLESGRMDSWKGRFSGNNQQARVDHPLMICLSKDGQRAIATASENYECLFHNQGIDYLLCIHSQQAPIERLGPGQEGVFRQVIYFNTGGIQGSLGAFENDVANGLFGAAFE